MTPSGMSSPTGINAAPTHSFDSPRLKPAAHIKFLEIAILTCHIAYPANEPTSGFHESDERQNDIKIT